MPTKLRTTQQEVIDMGFFGSKPKWVQRFYDGFGSKLQPWSDRLTKMDFTAETHAHLKKLCDMLPPALAEGLMKKIASMYRSEGQEKAETNARYILEIAKKFTF